MKPLQILVLGVAVAAALALLFMKGETAMIAVMAVILAILIFFSTVWRVMSFAKHPMAAEIRDRTVTWWWMVAVFMIALSTHKIVSFVFLGFLCFSALREYFSMVPMARDADRLQLAFEDRIPVLVCYVAIPLVIYLAYIDWYNLFVILGPVYLFLLMPILLILQNRTKGALQSLGFISLGMMFFLYNLGFCLFMINMSALVLLYCFVLTEVRDLLSFWLGKWLAKVARKTSRPRLGSLLQQRIAPDVSPNKTWAAGLGAAVLTSMLSLLFVPILPRFPMGSMSIGYCAMVGFVIGVLGLFGDLVFSMVKRDIGVKDSGNLLPGHGGIIDRVDSLVFTIPITFHLIRWAYY